jgi:hypothetical protein
MSKIAVAPANIAMSCSAQKRTLHAPAAVDKFKVKEGGKERRSIAPDAGSKDMGTHA